MESLSSKVQLVLTSQGLLGDDHKSLDSLDVLAMSDKRDVHTCGSATCPECSARKRNPSFLSHSELDGVSRWRNPVDTPRYYESSDSVDL